MEGWRDPRTPESQRQTISAALPGAGLGLFLTLQKDPAPSHDSWWLPCAALHNAAQAGPQGHFGFQLETAVQNVGPHGIPGCTSVKTGLSWARSTLLTTADAAGIPGRCGNDAGKPGGRHGMS